MLVGCYRFHPQAHSDCRHNDFLTAFFLRSAFSIGGFERFAVNAPIVPAAASKPAPTPTDAATEAVVEKTAAQQW